MSTMKWMGLKIEKYADGVVKLTPDDGQCHLLPVDIETIYEGFRNYLWGRK